MSALLPEAFRRHSAPVDEVVARAKQKPARRKVISQALKAARHPLSAEFARRPRAQ